MDVREQRRRRHADRSRRLGYRRQKPGIVAINTRCDHIPGYDGKCVRCPAQLGPPIAESV